MGTHSIHRDNDTKWTRVGHSQGLAGGGRILVLILVAG